MKVTPKQFEYLRMTEQRERSMFFWLWIDTLWTQEVSWWGLLQGGGHQPDMLPLPLVSS